MKNELRPEDLSFLDRAPIRQVRSTVVDLPPDKVFENIANRPVDWPQWFWVVRDCQYLGDPPCGVGTRRRLALRGGIVAIEKVLAWDQDSRFAFRVDEINLPGLQAFMEDWTTEPTPQGRTRLQWVLAADCGKLGRALLAAGSPVLDRILNRAGHRMAAS